MPVTAFKNYSSFLSKSSLSDCESVSSLDKSTVVFSSSLSESDLSMYGFSIFLVISTLVASSLTGSASSFLSNRLISSSGSSLLNAFTN